MTLPSPTAPSIALCKNSLYGPISGADETLVTFACHLHAAGHDVTVVLLYPPVPGDVFHRRLRRAGVPIVVIATHSRLYNLLRRIRRLAGIARRTIRPPGTPSLAPLALTAAPVPRNRSRDLWRSTVRRIVLRQLEPCRAHFRQAAYSVAHILTPDSGAEVMIRAAADTDTPALYHEMGRLITCPSLTGPISGWPR